MCISRHVESAVSGLFYNAVSHDYYKLGEPGEEPFFYSFRFSF